MSKSKQEDAERIIVVRLRESDKTNNIVRRSFVMKKQDTYCDVEIFRITEYGPDALSLCFHVHFLDLAILHVFRLGIFPRFPFRLVGGVLYASKSMVKSRFGCLHRRSGKSRLRCHNTFGCRCVGVRSVSIREQFEIENVNADATFWCGAGWQWN